MKTIKLNKVGENQIVRFPKEYRFNCNEVNINKIGDIMLIIPKKSKWNSFAKAIDMFTDDYMKDGRKLGY